jgi:hypothetical protein
MLIYDDRSRNVYENKQNHDKLIHKESDIYVEMTWILQKIAGLEGQFAANSVCGLRVIAPLREMLLPSFNPNS